MIRFKAYGHENITGKHKTTLEFTKDETLSKKGDCIIGVKSDFDSSQIMKYVKGKEKCLLVMEVDGLKEELEFFVNHNFCDKEEIVMRKSDYDSKRTLGIRALKGAKDIDRKIIDKMKEDGKVMKVTIK